MNCLIRKHAADIMNHLLMPGNSNAMVTLYSELKESDRDASYWRSCSISVEIVSYILFRHHHVSVRLSMFLSSQQA